VVTYRNLAVMVDSTGDIGGCDDGSVNDASIGEGGGESEVLRQVKYTVGAVCGSLGRRCRGFAGRRPTWTES
jgi:hypothetical protein